MAKQNQPRMITHLQRRAFQAGVAWVDEIGGSPSDAFLEQELTKRYPMPTQPRTIILSCSGGFMKVRFFDGEIQWMQTDRSWSPVFDRESTKALIDLLNNPTEDVDDA